MLLVICVLVHREDAGRTFEETLSFLAANGLFFSHDYFGFSINMWLLFAHGGGLHENATCAPLPSGAYASQCKHNDEPVPWANLSIAFLEAHNVHSHGIR